MSRMNNTSRSLQIISQQNGWDPSKVQGSQEAEWKDGGEVDLAAFYHVRETPFQQFSTTNSQLPKDTSEPCPDPGEGTTPSFHTPVLREAEDHRTTGADPFPEMPGSRPQGGRR